METSEDDYEEWRRAKAFKSYYVVWKQNSFNKMQNKESVFKSYYVVWKHNVKASIVKKLKLFKSYYVVWKPDS